MVFANITSKGNRIVVQFNGIPKNDDDIYSYLRTLDNIYKKERKFLILYDARNVGMVSLKLLRKQATYMKDREELTKKYMVRAAIIVSHAIKPVMHFLFTLKKPSIPCKIFTDLGAGQSFLRESKLPTSNCNFLH
jgi:hypothetical protein